MPGAGATTALRRKDFALRVALGGTIAGIVRGAVAYTMWPVAARFAVAPVLMLIVASAACAIPTWRAANANVIMALRED